MNPRRGDPAYVLSRPLANARGPLSGSALEAAGASSRPRYVDVLQTSAFLRSVSEAKNLSLLDEGRLANLWN
ncbi:MAG TPA: hypothetical protein VN612_06010 [Acidobacteriaceae bacterium]|nr:hypothetical protein [Acidobacteriaceae bacterium]